MAHKTKTTRLLSALLAVVLVVLLPSTAFAADAPELTAGEVLSDGHVELTFSKAMAAPPGGAAGFSVVRADGVSIAVTSATLVAGEPTKIRLTLATPIWGGDAPRVAYSGSGVQSSDGEQLAAIGSYSLANPLPHPTMDTLPLPNGAVGVPYSHTFSASGGTPPYTYYVYYDGGSPGVLNQIGLSLSSTGTLSGTPTQSGSFGVSPVIRISVRDQNQAINIRNITFTIQAAPSNVCEIGSTPYTSLDAALLAVGPTGETIKLLENITDNDGLAISNGREFTIDLNGKTLAVNNPSGEGLFVTNGTRISLTDTGSGGKWNVTGSTTGVHAANNSIITVTNATATGASGTGVYAETGSTVTVLGNVTATDALTGRGVNSNQSTVTVEGSISAYFYIHVGEGWRAPSFGVSDQSKPGYLKYFAPTEDASAVVWVAGSTPNPVAPTVVTNVATASYTTATLSGNVTSDGGAALDERGFVYGPSLNPEIGGLGVTTIIDAGTGTGSFSASPTGLLPGTLYHVRAYATNGVGTSYGGDVMFTTMEFAAPTVVTNDPTGLTDTAATLLGDVTSNGGAALSERGFVYNLTGVNLEIGEAGVTKVVAAGTGTGAFSAGITGLAQGTAYYVRAYAINSQGTRYGAAVPFTTLAAAPSPDPGPAGSFSVITNAVSDVTASRATLSGKVLADGAKVGQRGFVYGTSPNPTTSRAATLTVGNGEGSFTTAVFGLTPNTVYYVRAYALSGGSTFYGQNMSFTTALFDEVIDPPKTGDGFTPLWWPLGSALAAAWGVLFIRRRAEEKVSK